MTTKINKLNSFGALFLVCILFTGCSFQAKADNTPLPTEKTNTSISLEIPKYEVDPETFNLSIYQEDRLLPVSDAGEKRLVENFIKNDTKTSWNYPEDNIQVTIEPKPGYIHVSINSTTENDNQFKWPIISGESYNIPIGEGKQFSSNDEAWLQYLRGKEFSVLEQLSMPFWASVSGDASVLTILENPFRSNIMFSEQGSISFSLIHQYPAIDAEKENSFRIYLTENSPVQAAKIYRDYVIEQGNFVTLEQKAENNENIEKLYGAPMIYLWGDNMISPADINWPAFRAALETDIMNYISSLSPHTEIGNEAIQVFQEILDQNYIAEYQKNTICHYLSEVLRLPEFYDETVFVNKNQYIKDLLKNGLSALNDSNLINLNKHALAENLPEVFRPASDWMEDNTTSILMDLKNSGIDQAWIGLNNWEQAYQKPELVNSATEDGYLIGPYDSYHSIHEPGKEKWITAKFSDPTLFENATVTNQNGGKISGFNNVGRKLNPTLSMASVKERVEEVLKNQPFFNSWFIDCDATGEIYDDYTPEHITLIEQDLKSRIDRMTMIRDEYNMVIGSEGGNDFAASTIAFAHGIELQSFSWMDQDMKNNTESEYFIGKYYNPNGGVAEHFAKQIPLKEKYYKIFLDPKYDIPLFKLVYNDSVITSYHWDWSTFKIKGAVEERMLREVLFNTPPLYHLDGQEWEKYKQDIKTHTLVWSEFSRKAVLQEMTDYKILTDDGVVKQTQFGAELIVTANFGSTPYMYENQTIPALSLLITSDAGSQIYTPSVSEDNQ